MIQTRCFTCNGNHNSRDCPIEKKLSGYLKEFVGIQMEKIISTNICCPVCNQKKLKVLGDNSPSLDIVCLHCNRNFECKSKCLSVKQLPKDIIMNHGNYKKYIERQKRGLDFIIVIYKIDRKLKLLTITKVLYVNNKYINTNTNFQVHKKGPSHSKIIINDQTKLNSLYINGVTTYSYNKVYNELVAKLYKKN